MDMEIIARFVRSNCDRKYDMYDMCYYRRFITEFIQLELIFIRGFWCEEETTLAMYNGVY
jgi:hypothetical protein